MHESEAGEVFADTVAFYAAACNAVGIAQGAVWACDDRRVRERMADIRHRLPVNINEFLRERGTRKMATDAAVPEHRFREMYAFYRSIEEQYRLKTVMFGHIGQAHLHFNFLPESEEQYPTMREALRAVLAKAVELGGTVSAEHGIGKIKKDYLRMMFGDSAIEQMRTLKLVFDPKGILNPGTMF
jgi:D-lactate dehydrogenase (cytochrome)